MIRLAEVKQIACQHATTLKLMDEVEIELAFLIGVREHIDLPGSTQDMTYINCACVSDKGITKAVVE